MENKDDSELRITSFFGLTGHEKIETRTIVCSDSITLDQLYDRYEKKEDILVLSREEYDRILKAFGLRSNA